MTDHSNKHFRLSAASGKHTGGAKIDTALANYTGDGFVTALTQDGDSVEITAQIPEAGYYRER